MLMENKTNTIRLLTKMYADCFGFWMHEGLDIVEALQRALSEISEMRHNPFEPHGDLLDVEGKQAFIERIEKELYESEIMTDNKKLVDKIATFLEQEKNWQTLKDCWKLNGKSDDLRELLSKALKG